MFLGFSSSTLFFPSSSAVISPFTSLIFHLDNELKIKFDNCLMRTYLESQRRDAAG